MASLDGLPGLATRQIARQSAVPSGSVKIGALPTKFLARADSTGCETLAGNSSGFWLERA
jgi:hypothetical protein